jgi:hypothetical protein
VRDDAAEELEEMLGLADVARHVLLEQVLGRL